MEKVRREKPKRVKDVLKEFKRSLRKNNIRFVHTDWVNNIIDQVEGTANEEYKRGVNDGLSLAQTIMNNNLESFIEDIKKDNENV